MARTMSWRMTSSAITPTVSRVVSRQRRGVTSFIGSSPVSDVGHEDGENEEEAATGGGDEKEDRDAGVAEDAEVGGDAHEHGSTDDQRGENEPERDPVRNLLGPGEQELLVKGV